MDLWIGIVLITCPHSFFPLWNIVVTLNEKYLINLLLCCSFKTIYIKEQYGGLSFEIIIMIQGMSIEIQVISYNLQP